MSMKWGDVKPGDFVFGSDRNGTWNRRILVLSSPIPVHPYITTMDHVKIHVLCVAVGEKTVITTLTIQKCDLHRDILGYEISSSIA